MMVLCFFWGVVRSGGDEDGVLHSNLPCCDGQLDHWWWYCCLEEVGIKNMVGTKLRQLQTVSVLCTKPSSKHHHTSFLDINPCTVSQCCNEHLVFAHSERADISYLYTWTEIVKTYDQADLAASAPLHTTRLSLLFSSPCTASRTRAAVPWLHVFTSEVPKSRSAPTVVRWKC
jgi:hypothetical protein